MADLRNCTEVFHGKTHQRAYDGGRHLLGNYKTVVCNEEALQWVAEEDSEDGLVSDPFSESELRSKYPKVLLNSVWGRGADDPTTPDVRMLADATQGGANQHIWLAMKPSRPRLSESMRILFVLGNPVGTEFDGSKANRMVLTPEVGRWLVAIMGPGGLFYANAIGNFGLVGAGQNWGRRASAVLRCVLALVESNEIYPLCPGDALVQAENDIPDGHFLIVIFFLMILRYPRRAKSNGRKTIYSG